MRYTELQVTTNFSFLRGASHPEEMVKQAVALGYSELAITDRNTFAGVVRGHVAALKAGIRILPGCRLDLLNGPSLLAFPGTKEAYKKISALLTRGNLRTEKGDCHLFMDDVFEFAEGSKFVIISPSTLNSVYELDHGFVRDVARCKAVLGDDLYLSASRMYTVDDAKLLFRLDQLSRREGVPMVATNDVHYHHPSRRELQDLVTCVREKCTIQNAGYRLHQNAERYLKPAEEIQRLFQRYPEAIEMTQVFADHCRFSLSDLKYQYPKEVSGDDDPQDVLVRLVSEGAHRIYKGQVPSKVTTAVEYELKFIQEMNYASYFLTVYDLVRYARQENILCQGRGSAANSTVCFCLGITSVDPSKFELLFERFVSSARNEPPDIDVDFEHERREEVIQYIYRKYGRDRAAIVATVTQQHHKGAIRDVGKAMGLSVDTINRLSSSMWEFTDEWFDAETLSRHGLNPEDTVLRKVLELTAQFMGFPRQLGQHTGGFVITEGNISDLCPVLNARMENRTCIEWNKDDIEALGFLKIDVLALGMLTCIRKGFDLARKHYGLELTLANIPQDDPAVYEMVSHADTIGVFQIESRAQQSMLPRLKPKCFYDLVIEVAIVRPGPIQGDMVHPYLRRRNEEEKVEYPSEALKAILERTLGVPLFQEQAMKIAIVAAGFTPAEADELRRSMATFKAKGTVADFEKKLISGMMSNGYSEEYARRVFRQLEGFGSYGFPESHAVSFALLVYVSSWLKCYYPDVFACALLNSMPMGFYQPAQIVIDAGNHGVEMAPVDVNLSDWDNQLEPGYGKFRVLRLGFRQVKGIREEDARSLVLMRKEGFTSVRDMQEKGITDAVLERLADADAFRSIGLERRQALWEVSVKDKPLAVFKGLSAEAVNEHVHELPAMELSEHVVHDYAATSLSLKAHPVSFVREELTLLKAVPASGLKHLRDGDQVRIAGLVLVRQRPGTASGICFITLEDETGCANLVVFEKLFNQYRPEILQSSLLMAEGKLQIEGEVIHVIVSRCMNCSGLLRKLTRTQQEDVVTTPVSRADERSAIPDERNKIPLAGVQGKIFPEGRNFR